MSLPSPDPAAPRPAVSAVLLRDRSVLLVRRAHGAASGLWSFPGGHVEPGETEAAAALRELGEETGLTARLVGRLGEHRLVAHDARGGEVRYVIAVLYGWLADGEPVAASDAAEARLVAIDAVGALATTDGAGAYVARAARLLGVG